MALASLCPRPAAATDLADAFLAAYGTATWAPIPNLTPPKPDRLVPIGHHRWAVLAYRGMKNFTGNPPGTISIAYARHVGRDWKLVARWPDFVPVSPGGGRVLADERTIASGNRRLYFVTATICVTSSCSDNIAVIDLADTGPMRLGNIPGGANFPTEPTDHFIQDCPSYEYDAEIGRPRNRRDLFSITYRGWTAPVGRQSPRTSFSISTEATRHGGLLRLVPEVRIPDCAR